MSRDLWLRDRWRHVTSNGQSRDHVCKAFSTGICLGIVIDSY